jgi:hypothetical protein
VEGLVVMLVDEVGFPVKPLYDIRVTPADPVVLIVSTMIGIAGAEFILQGDHEELQGDLIVVVNSGH